MVKRTIQKKCQPVTSIALELLSQEYTVYKFNTNYQIDKAIFDNEFLSIDRNNQQNQFNIVK
jgi:hypothetical protein